METVVQFLCSLFATSPSRLGDLLNHPGNYTKAVDYLRKQRLVTSYHKPQGKRLFLNHISTQSADKLMAYEGYLNVTVRQHMYCCHRLVLNYAYLPCLATQVKDNHFRYYPMELVLVQPAGSGKEEEDSSFYESFAALHLKDTPIPTPTPYEPMEW